MQALEQIIVLAFRGLRIEESKIPFLLQEIKKLGTRKRSMTDLATAGAMVR